MRSAAVLV